MTKTVLITGSTDGLGLLTAKLLHAKGHRVLLHGRSASKLVTAAEEVAGADAHLIETHLSDLSDLNAVGMLVETLLTQHKQLDVVINNAGVYKTPKPLAANGLDVRFVVNTLAPYKLTRGLLPVVPSDGRIINLSSAAQATIDLDAMQGGRALEDMEAYAQSKRAVVLWSMALADEFAAGPSVLAVNPGSLLASKMVKEGFGVAGKDLNIGADLLVEMATAHEFHGKTGQYFDNDAGRFAEISRSQIDPVMTLLDKLIA